MADTIALSAPRTHMGTPFAVPHQNQNQNDDSNNTTPIDFKKGIKYLLDHAPGNGINKVPPEYILPLPANPLSVSPGDIPVIDLSGLNGPPESRNAVIKALSAACEEWGFFRIVNHGVEVELMQRMIKTAEEFFSQDLTEKMKYASEDVMSLCRYGTSLNTSKKHALHWRDFLRHYGHPFHNSIHLWPANPPHYRAVAKEYLGQVWKLAGKLGAAISEGLGLDEKYIEEAILGDGVQIVAVNYYPPCPEPEKTLGLAAHSDHCAITILMDNGVQGLQVRHNDEWVTVQPGLGTFVVNIGDTLEILTNGKYKSVEHRGTVNADKTRISVGAVHGPNLSKYIAPANQLVTEGEKLQFRPILYNDYMELQQNSTVRGKTALDVIRIKDD